MINVNYYFNETIFKLTLVVNDEFVVSKFSLSLLSVNDLSLQSTLEILFAPLDK